VKVLAAIQSQCINCLVSVGLDVTGILGIPVASIMSLVKDCGEMFLRLLSGNGVNKANVFVVAHDLEGLCPMYA
jgi:hypothetical protein